MDRRHTGLFSFCGDHISVHYDVKIAVACRMTARGPFSESEGTCVLRTILTGSLQASRI